MTSSQKLYTELLSLTKLFLTQEYLPSDKIFSEPETFTFFKTFAEKRQEGKNLHVNKPSPAPQPSVPKPTVIRNPAPPLLQKQDTQIKQAVPQNLKISLPPQKPIPDKTENRVPLEKAAKIQKNSAPSENEEKPFFTLETPSPLKIQEFTELRKIITEKLPHLRLVDLIPDDAEAKLLASLWTQEKKKTQAVILAFDDISKHLAFLGNIVKALEVFGITAQIADAHKIERNQGWEDLLQSKELKLVIASSSGFHHLKGLQKHYKEGAKQEPHFLGGHALMLLSDISFYFKEPALKISLWIALKKILSNISLA